MALIKNITQNIPTGNVKNINPNPAGSNPLKLLIVSYNKNTPINQQIIVNIIFKTFFKSINSYYK